MPETPEIPDQLPLAEVTAVSAEAIASAADYEPPETAHVLEAAKENVPMIDIHDAHHAASSWKEFFIHIATIVLGLLIAIGLEQTVEYFHNRHLANEARENIQKELSENASILQQNLDRLGVDQQQLAKDMDLLDSAAPDAQMLTALQYSWDLKRIRDAAWNAARTDGSIALIPAKEIEAANFLHSSNGEAIPVRFSYYTDIDTAAAIADHARAAGKLTQFERDQLRPLTASAIGRTRVLSRIITRQLNAIKETNLDPN
jgi:hypothetical protein